VKTRGVKVFGLWPKPGEVRLDLDAYGCSQVECANPWRPQTFAGSPLPFMFAFLVGIKESLWAQPLTGTNCAEQNREKIRTWLKRCDFKILSTGTLGFHYKVDAVEAQLYLWSLGCSIFAAWRQALLTEPFVFWRGQLCLPCTWTKVVTFLELGCERRERKTRGLCGVEARARRPAMPLEWHPAKCISAPPKGGGVGGLRVWSYLLPLTCKVIAVVAQLILWSHDCNIFAAWRQT